jgi:hypothetical protein
MKPLKELLQRQETSVLMRSEMRSPFVSRMATFLACNLRKGICILKKRASDAASHAIPWHRPGAARTDGKGCE